MSERTFIAVLVAGAVALGGLVAGGTIAVAEHVQRDACEGMGHTYSPAGPEGVSQCWVLP